jgi:hypothetical protein
MRTLALSLWLVAAAAFAAELDIPAEVPAEAGEWVVIKPKGDCVAVYYVALDGLKAFPASELKDPRNLVVQAHAPGRYRFEAVGTRDNVQVARRFVVVVGGVPPGPTPPGPNPPTPPGPNPPQPPTPSTDPIGAGGFAVLVTFDSSVTTRPPGELSVLYGKAVREYLDANCVADPTAPGWKAYRIWPADSDTARAPKLWSDAFGKTRGSKDWILIGNGTGGYSGPLPKTVDETLALLKKHKGG